MAQRKDAHVGDFQAPLFPPPSTWQPPVLPLPLPPQGAIVAVDVETRDDGIKAGLGPGWALGMGYICGVAAAWGNTRLYVPLRHPETENVDRGVAAAWLAEVYRRAGRLVFHNAPYDLGWINADFKVPPPRGPRVHDTMLAAFHVDENSLSLGLDALCTVHGVPGKDEALLREAAATYGVDPKSEMWRLPARYVGGYAEQDVTATLCLLPCLLAVLDAEQTRDAYEVDAELIACVVEMRRRGIRCNSTRVEAGQANLRHRCAEVLADLSHRLARPVTIDDVRSPQRMGELMRGEGIEFPVTGGTGQTSLAADWMQKSPHWLPRLAEQAARLTNASDKFFGNYLLGFTHRGRIHPTVNLYLNEDDNGRRTGTRSHRLSYSEPPLQQSPGDKMAGVDDIGAEVVAEFRGCLEPEEGELWLGPDFSQQEYRMIVHFASVLGLRKADEAVARYRSDPRTDYHTMVTQMVGFDVKYGADYGRRRAKDVNFAKAFGAGLVKFTEMTGMDPDEASAVMAQYDEELPFVKDMGKVCGDLAARRGYIRLIDGARIHYSLYEPAGWLESAELREVNDAAKRMGDRMRWAKGRARGPRAVAEEAWPGRRLRRADSHKAMNNLIQGSSARQTKRAMLTMWREGIVPLLQMHDEVPVSVADERTGVRVAEIMRDAIPLQVPLVVDAEYGVSWGTAKAVKDKKTKVVLYGATYAEARRLQQEGRWW